MRLRPLNSHHLNAVSRMTGTVETKIAMGPLCTAPVVTTVSLTGRKTLNFWV